MLKRQQMGEQMFQPAQVEATIGVLGGGAPGSTREHLGLAALLQAAHKVADRDGKRLADVIAEASGGKLTLDLTRYGVLRMPI